jgi:hypothetical protein
MITNLRLSANYRLLRSFRLRIRGQEDVKKSISLKFRLTEMYADSPAVAH